MCDQCKQKEMPEEVLPEYVLHWIKMGRYFGYPECCINAFCTRILLGKYAYDEKYNNCNDGFLPCDDHLAQINAGEIKIEDIIEKRICKTPYPLDEAE